LYLWVLKGIKKQLIMKNDKDKKLEVVELTLEEWRMSTRPNIYKNKKKYDRKRGKRSWRKDLD
jgi:hypothetical protein